MSEYWRAQRASAAGWTARLAGQHYVVRYSSRFRSVYGYVRPVHRRRIGWAVPDRAGGSEVPKLEDVEAVVALTHWPE